MDHEDKVPSIEAARNELLAAALAVLSTEYRAPHAHSADEAQYADERMALAALGLTRATNMLERDDQPVGWPRA